MNLVEFATIPGFCPLCGAILPLPVGNNDTKCRCGYKMKMAQWDGMLFSKTEVVLNEVEDDAILTSKELDKDVGPVIERTCTKCGHNQMSYKTQQLRSADEGMTIFYYCLNCDAVQKEDS